ncbi:MAG: type II secretion system protein GspD [bacterium]
MNPRAVPRFLMICAATLLLAAALARGVAAQSSEPVLISLDADNASVSTVLQTLASRSGLNIATSPEVQAQTISIHLKNTPFDEALDLTVRAAGFGYQRFGNSILVGNADRLEKEIGSVSFIADLQYAEATEVKKLIEVLTKNVEVDLQGNRIVAMGSPFVIDQIKNVVATVDRPPRSVMIQSRVIEVSSSNLEEMGIQWDKITKMSTILTEGDPGPSRNDEVPENLNFEKGDEYQDIYRQAEAIEVALDLLVTNGNAKILADAKVVALENRRAEIFIGDDIPVVITSLSGAGGFAAQQIQLEHIKVGIELNVLPRVSSGNEITMLVEPKVSSIVEFIGPDNDLPRTSERKATTTVRTQSGRTIYVGGLQSEDTKKTVQKVPLLGSIPYLGALFRHTRDEVQRRDLIIELTPTIIE